MLSLRLESAPRETAEFVFTGAELRQALAERSVVSDHLIWLGSPSARRPVGVRLSAILSFYDSDEPTMLDQQRANAGGFESTVRLRSGFEFKLFASVEEVEEKLKAADAADSWAEIFVGFQAQDHVGVVHINARHVERLTSARRPA